MTILIPSLCYIALLHAQPILILRAIQAVSEHGLTDSVTDGLIVATAVVYFGIAVGLTRSTWLEYC